MEVQLAALFGSSPAEMVELRRRLEKCLVFELKEIAQRFKLLSCVGKRKGELIENLLKLGQDGALDASLLTEQTQSVKLNDQVPELVLTLEEWLMWGEKNSSSVWPRLRTALGRMIVRRVSYRLGLTDDLEKVCCDLIDKCLNKNSRDNMSAILVTFPAAPKVTEEAIQKDKEMKEKVNKKFSEMLQKLREEAKEP